METIEEKAEEYISGYGDGYAPEGINVSQDPCEEERGFTLEDVKRIFIDGAKWALDSQWIDVSEELPYENHIWKHDDNATDMVLCESIKGTYFLDQMIRIERTGEWVWSKKDFIKAKKWMIISNSKI